MMVGFRAAISTLVTIALSLIFVVGSGTPTTAVGVDPFGELTPLVVVMDTSGSMDELVDPAATGLTARRIDAAQSAVLDLLPTIGEGRIYGMVAYPGRDAPTEGGCSVGRLETPLGPLDVSVASAAVRRMLPNGDTPTGPALLTAAETIRSQFGDDANGVIVLVSDGESNCGTPPCEVATDLRASGLEVQVNTVGFNVDGAAEGELRCIADATGGRYVAVTDEEGLREAVAAGALAALTVQVTPPTSVAVVSGTGMSGGGTIAVTVSANGRVPAADVRVGVSLELAGEGPGSILVAKPVRFLGNLAPGAPSTTLYFDVRPDDSSLHGKASGLAHWSTTVTSRNAAPVTATGTLTISDTLNPSGLGPLFDGITRVAVLGDSYSSGEGAGGNVFVDPASQGLYLPGTAGAASGDNSCHRAPTTYAAQIFGIDNVDLLACSGAVTSDFYSARQFGGGFLGIGAVEVEPQLAALRELAMSSPEPPQAVFLSVGGNDAGFQQMGERCIMGGFLAGLYPGGSALGEDCWKSIALDTRGFKDLQTEMLERAMAIEPDVARVLAAVDAVMNSPEALARRDGRVAPIVLVPYPRIIPSTDGAGAATSDCITGISAQEMGLLNTYFDAINTSVTLAGYQAHNAGRPVYVVSDVVDAFQPDHTVCEGWSKSYAVTLTSEQMVALTSDKLAALTKLGSPWKYFLSDKGTLLAPGASALLHPNVQGHEAMARAIVAWSNSRAAQPAVATSKPSWSDDILRARVLGAELVGLTLPTSAGGVVTIAGDGLLPGSTAVVRMNSVATVLGTAVVGADGTVSATLRVPSDTPAGDHTLRLFALDAQWNPVVEEQLVTVLPAGGSWLIAAIIGGAVIALLGVLGLFVVRRRRVTGS